jgi:hypothetical protein
MSTPMATHRTWLKELANRCESAWLTAVLPRSDDGRRRIETQRTIYVLDDGECVEVVRRDDGEPVSGMNGMRLVGWYYDVDGEPRSANVWRPGARAILWRPRRGTEPESVIALTSPTFGFVRVGRPNDELTTRPHLEEATPVSGVRPTPSAVRPTVVARAPTTESMARVHVGF